MISEKKINSDDGITENKSFEQKDSQSINQSCQMKEGNYVDNVPKSAPGLLDRKVMKIE